MRIGVGLEAGIEGSITFAWMVIEADGQRESHVRQA